MIEKNAALELAKKLIACPSVTPHDAGCQIILKAALEASGFQCENLRFNLVDNLWARFGNHAPLLVFAGHTDVVPSGPASDWHALPFHPEVRDSFLYGRGACDMKGAIAAMVVAAQHFITKNPNFPGSIGFLITSDEEGDALDGTQKVIETLTKRGEKIDYCIIGEPSSDKEIGDQIRIGRRGSLHGKLNVHGKQGHVAHPHLAINPIHQCALALHDLCQTIWDKGNDSFPPTTFQITNINSGTGAANVIPGHAEIFWNFRFGNVITSSELQERSEAILHHHALKYDLIRNESASPFLSKKGSLIQKTLLAIKEITGREAKCSTGGGTSDGRSIVKTGAELIELGASHATAHQVNECIKVEDLFILTICYEKILEYIFH